MAEMVMIKNVQRLFNDNLGQFDKKLFGLSSDTATCNNGSINKEADSG